MLQKVPLMILFRVVRVLSKISFGAMSVLVMTIIIGSLRATATPMCSRVTLETPILAPTTTIV